VSAVETLMASMISGFPPGWKPGRELRLWRFGPLTRPEQPERLRQTWRQERDQIAARSRASLRPRRGRERASASRAEPRGM